MIAAATNALMYSHAYLTTQELLARSIISVAVARPVSGLPSRLAMEPLPLMPTTSSVLRG